MSLLDPLLVELAHRHRRALLLGVGLATLESFAWLAAPWFGSDVIAALIEHRTPTALLLGWAGVLTVQTLANVGHLRILGDLGARIVAELGVRLHDHLQVLPIGWHQARRRGELLSLLGQDTWRIAGFVAHWLPQLVPTLLIGVGAAMMVLWIAPILGLSLLVLVPLYTLAMKYVAFRLRPVVAANLQADDVKHALAEQHLAQLPLTKAFAMETVTGRRFADQAERVRALGSLQQRRELAVSPMVRWLTAMLVLALLWFGAARVSAAAMTPADLVALLLYGLLLTQPVAQLAGLHARWQALRASTRRVRDVLMTSPEPDEGQRELAKVRGEIAFENVSFAYPGRPPLFTNLNFRIRAGETVALTGANGVGKSTLAHLLLRFMDPTSGRITLDGIDLRELRLAALRRHIGLVSQQVLLWHDTVAYNIGFGRPDATRAEIELAARAAKADDFIQRLPLGYDTVIGDDGQRLSGGQRQRIALARALLKDPPILILDEATAMFDPEGERDFISEARTLLRERTVLLITHRPESLRLADRVLRLEAGSLREV